MAVQLLKEQNKCDQIPLGLFDRLKRILPMAERVANGIVCEETEILEKIIPRMFEVMQTVAVFSCNYVKRGRFGRGHSYWIRQMLTIAERTKHGLINWKDKEMMEKLDEELTKITEDFDRAVDVEALYLAKKSGKHSLSQHGDGVFSVVSYRARPFA